MNNVPIVMISSNLWAAAAAVTLQSLLENYKGLKLLEIYIISGDMSEENRKRFESYNSKQVHVTVMMVDTHELEKMKVEGHHVLPIVYLKFGLQRLFPKYDKILLLDIDLLIKGDVSKLQEIDLDGYYAAGVADMTAMVTLGWHKRLNRIRYMNSGVVLFNAKRLRDEGAEEKCFRIRAEHPEYQCMEQDVFNDLFHDEIKFISPIWNLMTYNLRYSTVSQYSMNEINHFYNLEYEHFSDLEKEANIIHLTNVYKPWEYSDTYMGEEWMEVYKRTPFADIPLQLKPNPEKYEIRNPRKRVAKQTDEEITTHIITKKGPILKDWTPRKTTLKLLGIPVVSKNKEGFQTTFKVLGVPLFRREWKEYQERTFFLYFCVRTKPYWPHIKQRLDDLLGSCGLHVNSLLSNEDIVQYDKIAEQIKLLEAMRKEHQHRKESKDYEIII